MNEIFDRLKGAAKRAAGTVSAGISVAAEEQKIRECYFSLGKLCYEAAKAGLDASGADFDALYSRIDAAKERIRTLKEQEEISAEPYAEETDFVDAE